MNNPSFGAYKRELFDKFGFFDLRLIRNSDYVLNLKFIKNGARIVFNPAIKCYYYNRGNLWSLFKQYFLSSYYKAALLKTHKGLIKPRHLVPGFIFLLGLFLLVVSLFSSFALNFLLILASLYLLISIISGIRKPQYLPLLPLIDLTVHTAYGAGFLTGFIAFLLLGFSPHLPEADKVEDQKTSETSPI
jgi:hypothetical protein